MQWSDRLPSWRPGEAKDSVLDFLQEVTEGATAIPVPERIATFDNDGTLACEKPHTALGAFLEHTALEQGDGAVRIGSGHEVLRDLGKLLAGLTTEEYEQRARSFLESARHPRFDRHYPALVYAPVRELVELLTGLEFTVFLCSDSSRDFMRILAGQAYGLPREQVIGSEVRIELRNGRLIRTATPVPLDDGPGKVVHIWDRTGRRPVLAAGNAAGDVEMLTAARYALLVHHDDAEREYAYDDPSALAAAEKGRWNVVSMREDFGTVWNPGGDPNANRAARGNLPR